MQPPLNPHKRVRLFGLGSNISPFGKESYHYSGDSLLHGSF